MNKKILLMFVILIVAVAAISAASATDSIEVKDNTIKVNGIEFNIPDGYAYDENESNATIKEYDADPNTLAILKNGDDKIIWIEVVVNHDNEDVNELYNPGAKNITHETIKGKEGTRSVSDGLNDFQYFDGNKIVVIEVTDENIFSSVIK